MSVATAHQIGAGDSLAQQPFQRLIVDFFEPQELSTETMKYG